MLRNGNDVVLPEIKEYVNEGGRLLVAGFFPTNINRPDSQKFFNAFGLDWCRRGYGKQTYKLNTNTEALKKPKVLPEQLTLRSLNLAGVAPEDVVYATSNEAKESLETNGQAGMLEEWPVVQARVGRGWVGYVGDVRVSGEGVDIVLLGLLGLLDV